jgi:hypothetical protein
MSAPGKPACRACRFFRNEAHFLEAALPGWTALGSAHGSARSEDGLCLKHDRFTGAHGACGDFLPVTLPASARRAASVP